MAADSAGVEKPIFTAASNSPPPGFESLVDKQQTDADIYFNGEYLLSTFVEYNYQTVEIIDPQIVVHGIPTVINPSAMARALSGPMPTHANLVCGRRSGSDCGKLKPEYVGAIFDEGRFRLDLFIHADQLEIQSINVEKYLPNGDSGFALLHDLSVNASGRQGRDIYNVSSESFVSRGQSRLRARYGVNNNGGALHEVSWQRDYADAEAEVGSFQTFGRSLAFVSDVDILGMRIGSSTNTRVDLDAVLGNPILLFLDGRSRVDVFRNDELIDSHFYDAGNQQLDTSGLPDGAYDITLRIVDVDGREIEQTHFFVRSGLIPPKGEPQYYVEAGALMDTLDQHVPEFLNGAWLRAGTSRRLQDNFAVEGELLHADGVSLLQTGAYLFAPGWQFHAGLMRSNAGDVGYALRGNMRREDISMSFDLRKVDAKDQPQFSEEFSLISSSYTQATATLAFPLFTGQGYFRGRYNKRGNLAEDHAIGFSYLGQLFQRRLMSADVSFDVNWGKTQKSVRLGVNFRLRQGAHYTSVQPQVFSSSIEDQGRDTDMLLDARWNHTRRSAQFGDVQEGVYALHNPQRSVIGARGTSKTDYGFADLDVAHESGSEQSGFTYTTNGRFSLVTAEKKTSVGGGSSQLAAVVVSIESEDPSARFKVMVDDRIAGYADPSKRAVVSLRPYESYDVHVVPDGDTILGYDESTHRVTLYPGNVHSLAFAAREILVVVGQAQFESGAPVQNAKFRNVDGFGATDANGWFQVEVSHDDPLQLVDDDGEVCTLLVPRNAAEQGLLVLDDIICHPIQALR